ncbi:hypothetical protein C2G38_2251808 [Gigaspora rosea]|uniref:Uncharacterized protein n=1 Tax=Gigaspora rosea TaxID=44941 RepID=A0A397UHR3_9GLOM|nr:hypothetical protein C2G38_2251808 [Gigaspora rosea]
MGIYKLYKCRFHLKNACFKKHQKQLKEQEASIEEEPECSQRTQLISTIWQLSKEELPSANNLISIIRYLKGPNKGKLISPYLQKKSYNYIVQSLYKSKSDYLKAQYSCDQKSKHIAEIRLLVQRSHQITNEKFRKKVKTIFNPNKKCYLSNTIWLATNVLQVGQISLHSTVECMRLVYEFLVGEPPWDWLSTSTLRTWHQDVSESQFKEQIYQIRNALTFGIMIDESTQGQIKNLILCYQYWNENDQLPSVIVAQLQHVIKCNANTTSDVVIKHIQEYNLDIKKCTILTTDNTSYMSGDKKGAVALFNKKTNENSLRIGCGLHIIQINMNHFEQKAFGALANSTGFLRKPYPFLQEVAKMFFADELLEVLETLPSEVFRVLFEDLEKGINKALDHFEKWFAPWLYLLLAVCHLDSNNARSFAFSFYRIVLKKPWARLPNDLELWFAEELEDDLRNGKTDSLGLYELLLQDNNFFCEFEEFCNLFHNYPPTTSERPLQQIRYKNVP